ncbi:hypothetical protein IGI37_000724 [Enterococcus sp. AZ194]|uniref:hypothetical protein n=1 Tax=Enterococcus sp. AZ194 TaxID=2774629 RepID=UPI003F1F710E
MKPKQKEFSALYSLRKRETSNSQKIKAQQNTIWHWGALFLFACLVVASPIQQLLIVLVFVTCSAIIKGPFMIILGTLYAFLVGLFPPIALAISFLFFILQIGELVKTWRVYLVGSFFYLYPLLTMFLRQFFFAQTQWFLFAALLLGLTACHFLLNWLYKERALSRSVALFLFGLPYDFLLLLLPHSFKKKYNLGKKSMVSPQLDR